MFLRDCLCISATLSAAARPWALEYMGSKTVRDVLDPSLQHFSDAELLEVSTEIHPFSIAWSEFGLFFHADAELGIHPLAHLPQRTR